MKKLELNLKVDTTERKEGESEKGSYEVFTTKLKTEDGKIVTIKSPSDLGFSQGDSIKILIESTQKTLDEELKEVRDKP